MADDRDLERALPGAVKIFEDFLGLPRALSRDLAYELVLTFAEAVEGCAREVQLLRREPCEACEGEGGAPGAIRVACTSCNGARHASRTLGPYAITQPCPDCGGAGARWTRACDACGGEGALGRAETVIVKVPGGARAGHRLKLEGQGERRGDERGDAYITIAIVEDARFRREGDDLHLRARVSRKLAKRGGTIEIALPSGPQRIAIEAGVRSGRERVVRGWGAVKLGSPTMPIVESRGDEPYRSVDPRDHRGDLVITFEVDGEPLPDAKLTVEERELARADRRFRWGVVVAVLVVLGATIYSILTR